MLQSECSRRPAFECLLRSLEHSSAVLRVSHVASHSPDVRGKMFGLYFRPTETFLASMACGLSEKVMLEPKLQFQKLHANRDNKSDTDSWCEIGVSEPKQMLQNGMMRTTETAAITAGSHAK